MDISIIIPAFNEQERIAPTLRTLCAYLDGLSVSHEILVVDDGSTDGTVALVTSMQEELPSLRCIDGIENRGKGFAVRRGMLAARGSVRVMCDADGSMSPEELPKLLGPVFRGEVDIVIGSRYVQGASTDMAQPGWRVLWSRFANTVIRRSLVPGIRDTQCGYKAFSAAAAEKVFSRATIDGWSFDLEVLALAGRMGFPIQERGVAWTDDERSRISPVRDFIYVVREFLTIRSNFRRGHYGLLES